MSIYDSLLAEVQLPHFRKVHMEVPKGRIRREDIDGIVRGRMTECAVPARLQPGETVAVGAGSRDIRNYDCIVRSVVDV